MQGWSFWGLERWVTIFVGNMPSTLPPLPKKIGVNRQFQAKMAIYKNRNKISKTINRIKTKFEDQAETDNCTLCVV